MSVEKPDPKVIATRDWARSRVAWKPGKPALRCRQLGAFSNLPMPPRHDLCDNPACGCDCHTVTDADRQLWQRIADEIDAHLEPEPVADGAQEGLFA